MTPINNKVIKIVVYTVLSLLTFISTVSVLLGIFKLSCPNGSPDDTRWGCGYSMQDLNEMNCKKIGGTFFYGGTFSAGSCVK